MKQLKLFCICTAAVFEDVLEVEVLVETC